MSIQDDIFDVQDGLERKSEREAFDRIMKEFNRLETENLHMSAVIMNIQKGFSALKVILNE